MLLNRYKVISKNLAVWGILFCMLFFSDLQAKAAKEQMPDTYEEVLQAKNLASGVDNGCKWSIDAEGKLTIRSVESDSNLRNDAWRWYRDKITSVDIDVPYSDMLYGMFKEFTNLRTAKVKIDHCMGNASFMFAGCDQLKNLDLSHLNTNDIYGMGYMFNECKNLEKLDLSHADVKNLRTTEGMFSECEKIKSIKIAGWDARNLMNTRNMFSYCSSLVELDLSGWKTQRLMDMSNMFCDCSSLKTLDLNMMKTANVRNMDSMFYNCSSLVSLNLKHFNTQKVKSMRSMFWGCSTLRSLDLSSFHLTSYREDGISLFLDCDNLETVMVPCDLSHKFDLTGGWYRDDTMQAISCLPMNLTQSIQIHKQVNGNPFLDVRTTQWQYENVKFAFDKRLMRGKEINDNGHYIFEADASMTRAEFVQTLYNHSGQKYNSYEKIFSDVSKGKWYTNAILWAYDQKLVSGIGNKRFGVNDKITRQDMITILYKYAEKSNEKFVEGASKFSISSYTDSKNVVSYAVLPMKWATGNKIMNGKPVSKNKYMLDPKGNTTRAECAAVMKNYMTYIEKIKG